MIPSALLAPAKIDPDQSLSVIKKQLQENEQKFRSLFTSSLEGIVFTDLEGKIFDANPAYIELTGYSLEELKKKTTYQLTPSKWHQFEKAVVVKQLLSRGYSDEYEKEYLKKDGTVIPVVLRKWVSKDETGHPLGFWSSFRDITEQKRVEKELKQIATLQTEKNQELQKFNQLMIGRELKMIELKEKNAQLMQQLKQLQQVIEKLEPDKHEAKK